MRKKIGKALRTAADKVDPPKRIELWMQGIWLTAEREEIPVAQIEDGHLMNIGGLMYRQAQAKADREALAALALPGPNGDVAQDLLTRETDDWASNGAAYELERHPFFPYLYRELELRGLWDRFAQSVGGRESYLRDLGYDRPNDEHLWGPPPIDSDDLPY